MNKETNTQTFRQKYMSWGKHQKRIVRRAWITTFRPDLDSNVNDNPAAFKNRIDGQPAPQEEINWIINFDPLTWTDNQTNQAV